MKKEFSFGLIPVRKSKGKWQTLLVKHGKGHWGFPKGHPEENETPEATAIREFKEETGLSVIRLLPLSPIEETYYYTFKGESMHKKVVYYLAEVKGRLSIDPKEIAEAKWVLLEEAEELATFPETKRLCRNICQLFKSFL